MFLDIKQEPQAITTTTTTTTTTAASLTTTTTTEGIKQEPNETLVNADSASRLAPPPGEEFGSGEVKLEGVEEGGGVSRQLFGGDGGPPVFTRQGSQVLHCGTKKQVCPHA